MVSTLSTWLHREFISLSTSESRVSIRSLASSRALDQGVPMDHILTLGNWASSATLQDHYQRTPMARIDFTSTVLSGSNDDHFFDTEDHSSLDYYNNISYFLLTVSNNSFENFLDLELTIRPEEQNRKCYYPLLSFTLYDRA